MIIGFTGRRRSGKDTAAAAFVSEGFELFKFAEGFKVMIRAYLDYRGMGGASAFDLIEGTLKDHPNTLFEGQSTRFAMQTIGTEWGRNIIGESIWVATCMDRCKQFENVVISDCRFQNEADAIRAAGGKVIRIIRTPRDTGAADGHSSETEMDAIPVDFEVLNDGTIAELHWKVLDILENLR